MTIGGSLFVIALGAILRYAVEDSIKGVDLPTIGLILMLVGLAGLLFRDLLRLHPARPARLACGALRRAPAASALLSGGEWPARRFAEA